MREHGTRAKYVVDKCRCQPCRDVNVAIEAARRRAIAYGTWAPYVDAEPARRHVRELMAAGIGWKRVARLSGLSTGVVWKLLYGDPQRNMAPSKRCRPATAEKLLAVHASPENLAGGQKIPAEMTWRRIHSLIALGYPRRWIAAHIAGHPVAAMQIRETVVFAGTARAVKDLYDRIGDTPAPPSVGASRAVREAARNRWPVPAAWDDDGHDLPIEADVIDDMAIERVIAGEHLELTPHERIEAARRMHAAGHTKTHIAVLLHVSSHTINKLLEMVA
jgi:hypothetical protein